jgi:hypothetical protein
MTTRGSHPVHARVPWPAENQAEVPYERPAPRQTVTWTCRRGHRFETVFAAGADVPDGWECRCGAPAGHTAPDLGESAWEHHRRLVAQRRTPEQAAAALAERLAEVRAGAR